MIVPTQAQRSRLLNTKDLLTCFHTSPTTVELRIFPWYVNHINLPRWLNFLRPSKKEEPVAVTNLQATFRNDQLLFPYCLCGCFARIVERRNGDVPDIEAWRNSIKKGISTNERKDVPLKRGTAVTIICGRAGTNAKAIPCDFFRMCLPILQQHLSHKQTVDASFIFACHKVTGHVLEMTPVRSFPKCTGMFAINKSVLFMLINTSRATTKGTPK